MIEPSDVSAMTWAIVGGRGPSEPGSPLNVAPILASNFASPSERVYSRENGTPSWEAFEELLGGMEGGSAVTFSSGMAAVAAVFDLLAPGASVVLPTDCYQRVTSLARAGERQGRWTVELLDVSDTAGWTQRAASADLLWLESPSNPLLEIADLPAICAAQRKPGSLIVVDNTLATPLGQSPLALGADIALHSATKFIGGHADLLLGATVARTEELTAQLRQRRAQQGATPGALETFLALRGARTLALRLRQASASALHLAEHLLGHPAIETVRYPGLPADPGHRLAQRDLAGFGAMISFDVRGGAQAADRVCSKVQVIRHATSLGGVESTIERRAVHAGQEHLPPGLLRLSVGCEEPGDLWADLDRALRD
jgi:cystathionine gamma-synthase